ncbi:MAG: hypothetical protein ACRDHP_08150 [Ktedonobacterales bacterium]
MDMETEYLIQEALEVVMRGRTTFVVASRLRTVKRADEILVLERGRILERGTHESLLRAKGAYSRLYDVQLREQEEFEAQALAARTGVDGHQLRLVREEADFNTEETKETEEHEDGGKESGRGVGPAPAGDVQLETSRVRGEGKR